MLRRCNFNSSDVDCTFERTSLAANCNPQILYLLNNISYYGLLVIVIMGIFGNGLGILLLLLAKCKGRHYSMDRFLITLFACDFGFLLNLALQLAKVAKFNTNLFWVYCQFSVYVANVLAFISQWSTWALLLERYLAICRSVLMVRGRNMTKMWALLIILALLLELWVFFVIKIDNEGRCNSRYGHTVFIFLTQLEAVLSYVIPGIMIVGFTLGAFLKIKCNNTPKVWLLMTIVIVDTILNLQVHGIRLISAWMKPKNVMCIGYRIMYIVSFMLYYLQYTLNVFYLLICPRE